jgi:ribosomal protein S27AE
MDVNHDVLSWFEHDELAVCPMCGERTVLPAWERKVVCVTCGIVPDPREPKAPS